MSEEKKNIVAVIPARGGSKSIPGKNIRLMGDHPLIAYSIAAGQQSELIDRVIVSTDDASIAEVAAKYGAEVPFQRPKELASDEATDFPVFEHVADWLMQEESYKADVIVQLRPTSPFRPVGSVDGAIKRILKYAEADSIRSVTPSGQNPYKMWTIQEKHLHPLLHSDLREPYNMPRQKLPETYWQTGHIDVFRYETIKGKKSLTGDVVLPWIIDQEFAIDLDDLIQWEYAEFLLNRKNWKIYLPKT